MDHSDDDEVQERDVTQLTEMGWTVRTFPGLNDSYTMTQMLHLLFNDFYMDVSWKDSPRINKGSKRKAHLKKSLIPIFDHPFDSTSHRTRSSTSTRREK